MTPTRTRPPAGRSRRRPGAIWLTIILLGATLPASADEASPELAKYHERLDEATDRALAYLAEKQLENGSFPISDGSGNTAVTGLAVMAFLAKGHTPGVGPYGHVINKGIDFVLSTQKPNGLLVAQQIANGPMYSHGIGTLMLSEVSGMVDPARQKRVDEALSKALQVILAAQQIRKPPTHQGGWRYSPTSGDSDISCTGWQLMALRSARNNGAEVPQQAIEEAVKFVLACKSPTGDGGFSYQPGHALGIARTATALTCLELTGHHRQPVTIAAGNWILNKGMDFYPGFFYYAVYYCSQGMFQLGGEHWEKFAPRLYDLLLARQQEDGSFRAGTQQEDGAGPCYSTAMGALALSVSFRQLPIYQR